MWFNINFFLSASVLLDCGICSKEKQGPDKSHSSALQIQKKIAKLIFGTPIAYVNDKMVHFYC